MRIIHFYSDSDIKITAHHVFSRSETVVERMLCNWMSICLYQFLKVTWGWSVTMYGMKYDNVTD